MMPQLRKAEKNSSRKYPFHRMNDSMTAKHRLNCRQKPHLISGRFLWTTKSFSLYSMNITNHIHFLLFLSSYKKNASHNSVLSSTESFYISGLQQFASLTISPMTCKFTTTACLDFMLMDNNAALKPAQVKKKKKEGCAVVVQEVSKLAREAGLDAVTSWIDRMRGKKKKKGPFCWAISRSGQTSACTKRAGGEQIWTRVCCENNKKKNWCP